MDFEPGQILAAYGKEGDFETLATFTYQFAKDEMLEAAALPALMIVMAGLFPVILMNGMLRRAG